MLIFFRVAAWAYLLLMLWLLVSVFGMAKMTAVTHQQPQKVQQVSK